MGSKSDLPVMQDAIEILKGFDIEVEVDIVSAHRTPEKLFDYGKNALNGAKNAGILAAQILGISDKCVLDKVQVYKESLKAKVIDSAKDLK